MTTKQSLATLTVASHLPKKLVRVRGQEKQGNGIFTAMTANQTMELAMALPNPRKLWKEFWYEGEVCCLFADTNVGKSVLAMQIAEHISHTDKVLYYDFELSEKQFQLRYVDGKTKPYKFSDNLLRMTLTTDEIAEMGDGMEDAIIKGIENNVVRHDAKILIIDNISWLLNTKNSLGTATKLMTRLKALRKYYGLSILVLAHCKKRTATKPIDQNDLAGSKRLIDFFDSAFTVGKSMADNKIRYIKQIKVRMDEHKYDSEHVMLCTMEKKKSFLQFIPQGEGDEADHLKKPKAEMRMMQIETVRQLKREGKSVRQIAMSTGLSKSTVDRLLKA